MANVLSKRCSHGSCARQPSLNFGGGKAAMFCRQHAEGGMVDVSHKRCSHDSCTKRPTFNVEGSKTAVCCKKHAKGDTVNVLVMLCWREFCTRQANFISEGSKTEVYCGGNADDGMVNVRENRCSSDSCMRSPSFNATGSKTAVYGRKHAENDMVSVLRKRCLHDSCTKQPYFNFEGSKAPVYCKPHAEECRVNVRDKRCSHGSCANPSTLKPKVSKTWAYCKQHAEEGITNVRIKPCSPDSCWKQSSWGLLTNDAPTVRASHKNNILDAVAITFRKPCEVVGCGELSKWGLDGKQPARCRDHARLEEGFVLPVGTAGGKGTFQTLCFRASQGPTGRVKTEKMVVMLYLRTGTYWRCGPASCFCTNTERPIQWAWHSRQIFRKRFLHVLPEGLHTSLSCEPRQPFSVEGTSKSAMNNVGFWSRFVLHPNIPSVERRSLLWIQLLCCEEGVRPLFSLFGRRRPRRRSKF